MELKKSLATGNIKKFIEIITFLFSKIPYTLHIEKEAYYHSLFYLVLALMGMDIDIEILTDKGRVDGILELEDKIYVIEFKYGTTGDNMDKLTDRALMQIKDRKYYEKYLVKGKEIILLGVCFIYKNIGFKSESLPGEVS